MEKGYKDWYSRLSLYTYHNLPSSLNALSQYFMPLLRSLVPALRVADGRIVISSLEEALSADDFDTLAHMQRYVFCAKYLQDLDVLDCGCGTGYGSYYLATHGAKNVVGVDVSEEAIAYAKARFAAPNLKFLVMDGLNLKFKDQSFDAVVSFDVIEHVDQQTRFLSQIVRVTKLGGLLIIGTPNKAVKPSPGYLGGRHHVRELTLREFENMVRKCFEEVEIMGQDLMIQGLRARERFLRFASLGRLLLRNFIIVKDDVQHAFGLLAVCKKLQEIHK